MKWYPISEGELRFLAVADGASAAAFSFASACIVFALDLTKDFAISTGVPKEAAATWGGYRLVAVALAVASIAVGVALKIWRGNTVSELKKDTDFS